MSKSKMVTIKLPKYNSIFLKSENSSLYLYQGFHTKINDHILKTTAKDKKVKLYIIDFVCHSEFKEKYVKIGEL